MVLAEPAVYVLNEQIEEVTSGHIRKKNILYSLSIGVAIAVSLSMARILIPEMQLWHLLVPGYIIAITLSYFAPRLFVGIAFDSGSGLGPDGRDLYTGLCPGVAEATPGRCVDGGFWSNSHGGPDTLIAIQVLGLLYKQKALRVDMDAKSRGGYEYVINLVIVEFGMGSRILEEAKRPVLRGHHFLGRGTVRNPILKALGLDEARKEIVLMVTPTTCRTVHDHLTEKFQMEKPNHGIIVTMPLKRVYGLHDLTRKDSRRGGSSMDYEVIFTVVEKGLGQEAVDAATKAGSTGATIINARGSGIHECTKFFAMNIEPEKEIVMIIIERDKAEGIVNAIRDAMRIDDPGKGILFSMDVNRVTGLMCGKQQP